MPSFRRRHYVYKHGPKRIAASLLDAAGDLLTLPFRRPPVKVGNPKKILVIRIDQIGDAVMTRPAIKRLAESFPHAPIDVLASEQTAPLFRATPGISEVLVFQNSWLSTGASFFSSLAASGRIITLLRSKRYDLGIDFRGDLRSIALMAVAGIPIRVGFGITGGGFLLTHEASFPRDTHQVESNCRLLSVLGLELKAQGLDRFDYSKSHQEGFQQRLGSLLGESGLPRILIHPGANYPSKRWPQENFKELISKISRENMGRVILIGSNDEKDVLAINGSEHIADLRGLTRLEDLPVISDLCDLYIGNDSGPAHIAAAQGMEVVLLASGTNDIRYWHPWTNRLHLVQHTVPCSPCEARECPLGHHDCMTKISVSQVMQVVRTILQRGTLETQSKNA